MKVGFIGLGTMGGRMAANLLRGDIDLVITDLNRSAAADLERNGATWSDSPEELAQQVEVILLSLPGPPQIEAVVTRLSSGLAEGVTIIDLSTNSPKKVRELHEKLSTKNVHLLDAPVSGGPKGASSGKLAIWCSGQQDRYEAYLPILKLIGDDVQYLGGVGNASVAKLVHNCIGYAFNSIVAEMFTTGVKAGVPPETLFKAVRSGGIGRRRTFDQLPAHFLSENYDPPNFALALAHKDVSLAAELGRDMGVPMRMVQLTLEEMTEAMGCGWGNRDSRVAMLLQQHRAKVSMKCDAAVIKGILDE